MMTDWDDFGVSIFTRMTEESLQHKAINLAQGFPDFDPPKEILEEASSALFNGFNQYAPSFGLLPLREAIAHYVAKRYQLSYSPKDEVSVFSGASEAIFSVIMALCQPGDEVITFEPFYDIYQGCAFAAKATLKTVTLQPPTWEFDLTELEKAITPKSKILILNTPHNPTGKIFSLEELQSIAKLAEKHNLTVVTDEVYEELYFEPYVHSSFAALPGMKERTIIISSAAKTYSVTGWKIGSALGPKDLIRRMRIVHQHSVFCSATPMQKALIKAYELPESFYENLRKQYTERKNLLLSALTKKGYHCEDPQGTYFIVAKYSEFSSLDDLEFSLYLTRQVGVSCIPLSTFYLDKSKARKLQYIRFCFAKNLTTLEAAAGKLTANYSAS